MMLTPEHKRKELINRRMGGSFIKFRLFLNEEQIGAGPYRSVETGKKVLHTFAVRLHQGSNVLGIISRSEKDGFALSLDIEYVDGSREEIVSDAGFRMLDANEIYRNICWERPAISQYCKGDPGPGEYFEHIDGTKFPHGWLKPDFDDSGWKNAKPHGTVKEDFEYADPQNYELRLHAPQSIRKVSEGNYIIDFGREVVGSLRLAGPDKDAYVEIRLGEEMLEEDTVRFEMRTRNCYQELWHFPALEGVTLENFGIRAFRYAQVLDYTGTLTKDKIQVRTINRPFKWTDSDFKCSDDKLVKIWDFCKNTIAWTNLDVYMDCPSRERISYEADSYITMLSHFTVENNLAIARHTVEHQINHPTCPCEWRLMTAPLFYEYLMQSGDYATVEKYYPRLGKECSFLHLMKDGLVPEFPMMLLVDWPRIFRKDYEFGPDNSVPNAYVYNALISLAKIAALLKKPGDAAKYNDLAEQLKKAFNEKLFNPEQGLYRDSTGSDHCSFHANLFALSFDLVPPERVPKCLDFIAGKGMVCSLFAAQFYLETLIKYGRADLAIKLMTANGANSWQRMIDLGATVTTEIWNPIQEDYEYVCSWAHPWGASPANIITRGIFGLRPTKPGWEEFCFEPQPGSLEYGILTITTPKGKLHASFKQENGSCQKSLRPLTRSESRKELLPV
jgi:alpha-L-rhamnosidase